MQPSRFTVRVPLPERDEVFLLNTLTDAQAIVSPDVAALLDGRAPDTDDARQALHTLADHGFLVASRDEDDHAIAHSGEHQLKFLSLCDRTVALGQQLVDLGEIGFGFV